LKRHTLPDRAGESARFATALALVWLVPIAAVEYLESAPPLASNHHLGVPIAQIDLTNRPARGVNLPQNYRRAARRASRGPVR